MRLFLLFFFGVICCAAQSQQGFVAFRMDLMRVPGMNERNPDKAIRHSETRCVMTAFMNVLSGTRAKVKLYDRIDPVHCGFSVSASPEVHIPQRSALIDYSAFYRMPENGIFNSPLDSGFDSAVTMSSRRLLKVPKPSSTGLFAMPGEGAVVPLIRLDTLYPFFGTVTDIKNLECRLLAVSSEELRKYLKDNKIQLSVLSDPLPPEHAVNAFAAHPAGFSFSVPVKRGRGDISLKEHGITASFRRLSGATFRLTVKEMRDVGKRNGKAVQEEFNYEGYLVASSRWMLLVRLISPHAGERAFFERDKNGKAMEKLLLIRSE